MANRPPLKSKKAASGNLQDQGPLFNQAIDLPPHENFPLNRRHTMFTVGQIIEKDLQQSQRPFIVTGFSSLWYLVSFLGKREGWEKRDSIQLVFGFNLINKLGKQNKTDLPDLEEEIALLEEGFSPSNWSNLWRLIHLLKQGTVTVRFLDRLHAKIYIGDDYATLGSSNFSINGLKHQQEANIRVSRNANRTEASQYAAFVQMAQYFFQMGNPSIPI